MKTHCPYCNTVYEVGDEFINLETECLKCKKNFVIEDDSQNPLLNGTTVKQPLKKNISSENIFISIMVGIMVLVVIFAFAYDTVNGKQKTASSGNIVNDKEKAMQISKDMTEIAIEKYKKDHNGNLPEKEFLTKYRKKLYSNLYDLETFYLQIKRQKIELDELKCVQKTNIEEIIFNNKKNEHEKEKKRFSETLKNILSTGIKCEKNSCKKCSAISFPEEYIKFDYKGEQAYKLSDFFNKAYDILYEYGDVTGIFEEWNYIN